MPLVTLLAQPVISQSARASRPVVTEPKSQSLQEPQQVQLELAVFSASLAERVAMGKLIKTAVTAGLSRSRVALPGVAAPRTLLEMFGLQEDTQLLLMAVVFSCCRGSQLTALAEMRSSQQPIRASVECRVVFSSLQVKPRQARPELCVWLLE